MITSRPYENESDLYAISEFLNETYNLSEDQINWGAARWQYAAYFVHPMNLMRSNSYWLESIRIWEENNRIVGVVSYENKGNVYIQRHPKFVDITEEMIIWAEENLSILNENSTRKISIWINDQDEIKKQILSNRNYKKSVDFEYLRLHQLNEIYDYEISENFIISSLDKYKNIESKCDAIVKAFGSSGLPIELYQSLQSAPLYKDDLDIVAVHKNGEVAACGTMWFNQSTKTCYVEPMATSPEYQGCGLGKAILLEGLKRMKEKGAKIAYVGSYGEKAGAFYSSCGFEIYERNYPWTKTFD